MNVLNNILSHQEIIIAIIGVLTPIIYRALQKLVQYLPSEYKKIGNKIKPTTITIILRFLFGKTATFYKCFVKKDPKATEELLKIANQYINNKLK
ncbi:MAG: hypothetical protein M0R17_02440 [Candidatus Omnitrophica bacterium]|jgi:hypothetical protein|nr:hypothetical protein [Candidatus Omnitrophota bacterium]